MSMETTPFQTDQYDREILRTVPFYRELQTQILEVVHAAVGQREPVSWLDTGCGTGALAERVMREFAIERMQLCDPSAHMLDTARERLKDSGKVGCLRAASQELVYREEFDVVTAVLAHHYLSREARREAVARCWQALRPGGVFITVENFAPFHEQGIGIGLQRWRRFQEERGKSAEEAALHASRYNAGYFPITPAEHRALLLACGFSAAEPFWLSYMQIGLYALRGET